MTPQTACSIIAPCIHAWEGAFERAANLPPEPEFFDYVVIGSGFGGSVSALRLTEDGQRVLVLERGKRFSDDDFPTSNWQFWKYLWAPRLRFHGILQMSVLPGAFILHGSGVGGGSLVYAGVLMEPEAAFFDSSAWSHLADWKAELKPHYQTARKMLGAARNPKLWPNDVALEAVASAAGYRSSFRATEVGIFFGEPGLEVADPYFDGAGPERRGCIHCGGCMVGCLHNAKNTLVKNYLYLAEQLGAEIRSESTVTALRPLDRGYEIEVRRSSGRLRARSSTLRARRVVLAAGVLGTVSLLLRCRDRLRTLPRLSRELGENVRTNSESFVGAWSSDRHSDHSTGIAISSVVKVDPTTQVETLRFADGSSLLYWLLGTPMIKTSGRLLLRLARLILGVLRTPRAFLESKVGPGIARRNSALMLMQTEENRMRLRLNRRGKLMAEHDQEHQVPVSTELGHAVARAYAREIRGIPSISVTESLLQIPMTAHILGGCAFGRSAEEGVVNLDCEVFNYPGLYVVDGSIVPANPGINPSLTITALAEYAMGRISAGGSSQTRAGCA